jgi:nucleoside-diphosphate-sugar epimerase
VAIKLKIFITGVNSELMKRLVNLIDLDKYEVVGLSRKPIKIPNVTIVVGDLLVPESWHTALQNVDYLIHAAAITHTKNEKLYFEVNTQATKTLIDLSKKHNVNRFVYISSRTAVPNSGGYGLSKLAAEDYLTNNFTNYLTIKPSEIFGGIKSEGIEGLIEDAKHKKFVICPAQLKQLMYPIALNDVVELMHKYIFENAPNPKTIILNGPKGYSFIDVVKLVNQIKGSKSLIIPIPKVFMYFIKTIFKVLPINIGLVPDQIDRLYCKKETQKIDYNFTSLEEYIERS